MSVEAVLLGAKRGPKTKSETEKKVALQVYVKQSIVDDLGGIENVRPVILTAIHKAHKSTKKGKPSKKE